ncbi:hypothetical protein F2Q69_00055165 [Brassica cretica]|uniref:Uncharacterized protein n=1 Tax=Brassica cretica TaxID=69181 RepID=A0A8S9MVD7_BRACR|nr:hypothetical protein F2Q69_00055165 [Brassica cretica]
MSSEYTEGELRRYNSSEVHRSMRVWTYIHRSIGVYRRTFSSVYSEELFPRYIPRDQFLGIFRGTAPSEFSPRNPNFVFPRNFLGNSSVYSEDFIFRRNVRQNTAVFL